MRRLKTAALIAGIGLALVVGLRLAQTRQKQTAQDQPTAIHESSSYSYPTGKSVSDWFNESDVVADVLVESMGDAQFNTPGGRFTLDGEKWGGFIGAPVMLSVQHFYKGAKSEVGGLGVLQWGGTTQGFTENRDGTHKFSAGQEGVVFAKLLSAEPDSYETSEFPIYQVVRDMCQAKSSSGNEYIPALWSTFYLYYNNHAVNVTERTETVKADFVQELESLAP